MFDAATDGWTLILVTVQPDPPYAITDFSLHKGRRPADVPAPPKLRPDQLVAAVRAKIGDEVAADRFSGAVLIAQHNRTLLAAGYGLADRQARKPNTVHTQFRVGSMNKAFTEVAIMQLAQAGKLDLEAPLVRYLPGYPNSGVASRVTVDELLTHSSGMGDFFGPEFEAHRDALVDPKDYVALFGPRPLLFEPGSRQAYSNYGYIVLGRVVEAVSGLSYDEYLQRNVFGPAHMAATGARPETVRMPNRAVGYEMAQGRLQTASSFQVARGTPAGGGYSTVGDLLRFANALLKDRLLNADYTQRLTTGGATLPNGTVARYDFSNRTADGRIYFGHAGASHGQSADIRIFPDNDYVVVVLANRDPPIAAVLENFISDRLP
ncbi:MAG TPA: serine hydrolase domain-containing protein [Caulobacteraceae bacterium]